MGSVKLLIGSCDQPLNKWNVSNVEDMEGMFAGARSFNQPLNNWNVSKVKYMYNMFEGASSFNQPFTSNARAPLGLLIKFNNWDVSNVLL